MDKIDHVIPMLLQGKYEWATVQEIIANPRYPFTKGQLQNLLLNRHKNGLDKAVCKISKRIYFRIDLLDFWIDQHRGGR